MRLFVRKFNENAFVESSTDTYEILYYLPDPMKKAYIYLRSVDKMRRDDYLICPLYSAGDFQIGITGTVEEDESLAHAIYREMGEEIGFVPDEKGLKVVDDYISKGKPFRVYDAFYQFCIPVNSALNNVKLSRSKDSKKKVGAFFYGPRQRIFKNVLEYPKISRFKNEDDIVGFVAVQVGNIDKIIGFKD